PTISYLYPYTTLFRSRRESPEIPIEIANPLSEEFVYMRTTLVPSLLKVVNDNKDYNIVKIFEIGNTYHRNDSELPNQTLRLAGLDRKSTRLNSSHQII